MTNTISLKNAKKLKDVADKYGIKLPESKYIWEGNIAGTHTYTDANGKDKTAEYVIKEDGGFCLVDRANQHLLDELGFLTYTTNELLEFLPNRIDERYFSLQKGKDIYYARYSTPSPYNTEANTPQDALCLLAIKLIKKGIIKPQN